MSFLMASSAVLRRRCFLLLLQISFLTHFAAAQYSSPQVYQMCSSSSFRNGSTYQHSLSTLLGRLTNLSSHSAYNNAFYGSTDLDTVYGMFQCRGDTAISDCSQCVAYSVSVITQICPNATGARLQLDACFLRYENHSFFVPDFAYVVGLINTLNSSDDTFRNNREDVLNTVIEEAPQHSGFNDSQAGDKLTNTVYGLAQCLGYLIPDDCTKCLSQVSGFSQIVKNATGGQIHYATCYFRYESYLFFQENTSSPSPSYPPGNTSKGPTSSNSKPPLKQGSTSSNSRRTIFIAVVATTAALLSLVLFCLYIFFWRRKRARLAPKVLAEKDLESLQDFEKATKLFSLDELQSATANFDPENKLGEGGFGAVYKGKLEDGQDVAIKKLSSISRQGKQEFLNEINIITSVQHRNLIKLLGCCVEGSERLLVYEYLSQKSLDKHIFDSDDGLITDWQTRQEIILGTAKGLAYLHEDSQVKIIHRDIKTSNILLDDSLNPKIADFGLARLFPEDQSHVSTRVAGTLGYLAPEYAMHGQLTEKADVFSFGLVALETISGRRNIDVNLPVENQRLLALAWRLYEERRPLELVDPRLGNTFVAEDIIRVVHVALLCIQGIPELRPTMSSVVMMLAGVSDILEIPVQPAFVNMVDSREGKAGSPPTSTGTSGWDRPSSNLSTALSDASSTHGITRTSISDVVDPR